MLGVMLSMSPQAYKNRSYPADAKYFSTIRLNSQLGSKPVTPKHISSSCYSTIFKMASDSTTTTPTPKPPSPSVTALAVLKVAFGLGCLLAPRLTSTLLLLDPVSAQAAVVTRLYGGAVASLGYLLWVVGRAHARGEASTQVLRHVVAVNIAADAADVMSCMAGYATGALKAPVFALVGGGCAALEILGMVAYRTV